MWVEDQRGRIIFLHEFNYTDATPEVSFAVPSGVTELTPFEHCNLHQTWQGNSMTIEWQRTAAAKESLNTPYTPVYWPASFASKPPSHVPVLAVSGTTATVSVGGSVHGMSAAHHITAVWVRDQTGLVVYMRTFATDGSETPVVSFSIPAGSTSLTPYEHCNLHGTWVGARVYPAWETSAAALVAANTLPNPYNLTYFATGFATKPPSHIPVLSALGMAGTLTVGATLHGTSLSHYITSAWATDQHGKVIFYQSWGTSDTPIVSFAIPPGTTSVTAYEHCNLHGVWEAEPLDLLTQHTSTAASHIAEGLYNGSYFPASYSTKPPSHVPSLSLSGSVATVSVSHGMSQVHLPAPRPAFLVTTITAASCHPFPAPLAGMLV